jgi:hypothetical protein
MSDVHVKRIALVIVVVLAAFAVSFHLVAGPPLPSPSPVAPSVGALATTNPSQVGAVSSTQPKITWSNNPIEVFIAPGESSSENAHFASTLGLRDVMIEPVPGIAGFLAIQPSSITNIPAGLPQQVKVSFSIPQSTPLGIYEGAIHARIGNQTLPETLKVILNVWRRITEPGLNFSYLLPPAWTATTTDSTVNLSSPALQNLLQQQEAEVPPADIIIRSIPNLSLFSLSDFAIQFDNGWFESYYSKTVATVAGHSAMRYSDVGAPTGGHLPLVALLVEDPVRERVLLITLFPVTSVDDAVVWFDDIVGTIQIE